MIICSYLIILRRHVERHVDAFYQPQKAVDRFYLLSILLWIIRDNVPFAFTYLVIVWQQLLGTISLRFRFEVNFGVWYSIRVICSPPEYQLLALFFRARRFNFKILSLESFGLDAVKSNLTSLLSCDIFFGFYIIFITLRSLSMSQRSSRNCYSWSYDYIFNWVYFTDFIGFKAVKNNLFSLGGDCTAYYILSFHGGLNFVNFK